MLSSFWFQKKPSILVLFVFYGTSGFILILKLIPWILKIFDFDHFHKEIMINLV
jgi:hypothetical protein